MAIELIIRHNCDLHLQGDQKVGGETIPPVTLPNGKQKVLELCTPCKKEISYDQLIDLAILVGRDPEKEEGLLETPTIKCEYCHRKFAKPQGLGMHIRRSHPEVAAEAKGTEQEPVVLDGSEGTIVVTEPKIHHCDPCDRDFRTSTALIQHERGHEHQENVILAEHDDSLIYCAEEDCDRSFNTEHALSVHVGRSHKTVTV